MKKLLVLLALLPSCVLGADTAIGSLTHRTTPFAITDAMVWAIPGVSDYNMQYTDLTNILAQLFDPAGAAQAATNATAIVKIVTNSSPLSVNITGSAGSASSVAASNVFSGGVIPIGSMAQSNSYAIGGTYTVDSGGTRVITNFLSQVSVGGSSVTSGTATNLAGGATNQVYTQTGWSGTPTVSNLTVTGNSTNKGISYFGSTQQGYMGSDGVVNTPGIYVTGNGSIAAGYLQDISSAKGYLSTVVSGFDMQIVSRNQAAGNVVLQVKGAASQSNDVFQVANSSGALLFQVSSNGVATITNGVINYGTGWTGTTGAAPVNAITPVAWKIYTNTTGGVFKEPLYQ